MHRVLSMLLDGACHSGQDISQNIGVSRAMVWKHITRLREQGCAIESLPGRGYRLSQPPDIMSREVLAFCLQDGRPLQALDEVDSTNRVAKEWAGQGAPSGALVTAESQLAGRGRRGRSWQSTAKANIAMSLILRPGAVPGGIQSITLLAAVALCQALEEFCGLSPKIKWPNDLLVGEKKISGILTEMVSDLEGEMYLVVGIGVNVKEKDFPLELAETATSLYLAAGAYFNRPRLTALICKNIEGLMALWQQKGFAPIADLYRARMAFLDSWVTITRGEDKKAVKITGISDQGVLQGLDENGMPVDTISGEVTVRRM